MEKVEVNGKMIQNLKSRHTVKGRSLNQKLNLILLIKCMQVCVFDKRNINNYNFQFTFFFFFFEAEIV